LRMSKRTLLHMRSTVRSKAACEVTAVLLRSSEGNSVDGSKAKIDSKLTLRQFHVKTPPAGSELALQTQLAVASSGGQVNFYRSAGKSEWKFRLRNQAAAVPERE
jgi:hypothetical protein